MGILPEGTSDSDVGRVLVLKDPPTRVIVDGVALEDPSKVGTDV
jgi:hypothetical protein